MASPPAAVVPAQLGFLAIFNPSLGVSDETIDDQIVYYASVSTQSQTQPQPRRKYRSKAAATTARPTDAVSRAERNERLRQIGLAQGMVAFGRSFSGDQPVDTIETEKTRVVLHELEPGWWILASIDLTRLPLPAKSSSSATAAASSSSAGARAGVAAPADEGNFEYSSREVKPAALLLQDLLRAYGVFLLHHDASLGAMFARCRRSRFVALLGRYWDLFLSTWNVLLHGNPVCNVFGGIKVAACGELGIGVGEEERGSGEREVLEGLVGRIDGLVDLVVSKFGDEEELDPLARAGQDRTKEPSSVKTEPWLGTGSEPGAEDGAIFLGVGDVSRRSLRDITHWMEDLFSWGGDAYGVTDSPTSRRRVRRPKKPSSDAKLSPARAVLLPPPPITGGLPAVRTEEPMQQPKSARRGHRGSRSGSKGSSGAEDPEGGGMDKFVSYLKLGYGTYWSLGGSPSESGGGSSKGATETRTRASRAAEDGGHYLIGLVGDVEETASSDPEDLVSDHSDDAGHDSRTLVRTLIVESETEGKSTSESQDNKLGATHGAQPSAQKIDEEGNLGETNDPNAQYRKRTRKLRVVVYVNRPFIFTFLFDPNTDSLAQDSLYRSLHYQLSPLRRPLLQSTAYRPGKPAAGSSSSSAESAHIYDLIWDPRAMTVHSTIPNIPDPPPPVSSSASAQLGQGQGRRRAEEEVWSRVEALNTHTQLLNTYAATKGDAAELERTAKTSRGWWIVWSRVVERPAGARDSGLEDVEEEDEGKSDGFNEDDNGEIARGEVQEVQARDLIVSKEIFLIRKASDHAGYGIRGVSGGYAISGGGGGGWADGANRLAQGIGVDTRKYIEGLLSLNR